MKCTVKSANERNPYRMLLFHTRLPVLNRRKVGMTSDQRDPYVLGDTRVTMGSNNGLRNRKVELIPTNLPPVRIEG